MNQLSANDRYDRVYAETTARRLRIVFMHVTERLLNLAIRLGQSGHKLHKNAVSWGPSEEFSVVVSQWLYMEE